MYSDDEIRRMFPLEQMIPLKKADKLGVGKKLPRKARYMFDNMAILEEERNSLYNDYIRKALGQEISNCCSHKVFNTKIDNIPYKVDNVLHIQNPSTPVQASSSTNTQGPLSPMSKYKTIGKDPEDLQQKIEAAKKERERRAGGRETINISKKSVAQQIRERGKQIVQDVLSPGRRKTRSKTKQESGAGSSTDPSNNDLGV